MNDVGDAVTHRMYKFYLRLLQANEQNIKEKSRTFLAKLLEISNRESGPAARNMHTAIQELIDANIEPGEFCDRLNRILNVNRHRQTSLVGFLEVNINIKFI